MVRTRAMRRRNPSIAAHLNAAPQPSVVHQQPARRANRRSNSYLHRRQAVGPRELGELKELQQRRRQPELCQPPPPKKSLKLALELPGQRRQPSIRHSPPRPARTEAGNLLQLRRQPSIRRQFPTRRRSSAADALARLIQLPHQVQRVRRPRVHLESLDRPISPPPLRRGPPNQKLRRTESIPSGNSPARKAVDAPPPSQSLKRKRKPARRTPTIRRENPLARAASKDHPSAKTHRARRTSTIRRERALAWDAPVDNSVDPHEVAREVFRFRDLRRQMATALPAERPLLHAAFEEGRLPHEFSTSQLALAGIIGRAKPVGMNTGYFVQKLLKRARHADKVVTDGQLCFDSIDFLRHSAHENREECLEWKGKYEEERIRRKRLELALKEAAEGRQPSREREDATQLLADHQKEVDGDVDMDGHYPNIEGGAVVTPQSEKKNLPLSCYVLLRHARALHALLLEQTISPTRLSSCILKTIQLITDVLESTTNRDPTHHTKDDLRQTFKITSSVYAICQRGLNHLCRDISGRREKNRVIYQLCSVFKTGLKHNAELAQNVAQEAYAIARDDMPLGQRRVMSGLELHEVEVLYLLSLRTEFLAAIFLSKELSTLLRPKCYTEVLEGMSAELYTKVGTLISETVFKEKIADSNLPGRISLIPPNGRPDEVRELAVAVERDQVLKLLRVVVRRLSSSAVEGGDGEGASPASHLAQLISTEKLLTGSEGNHGRLFKIAKEKLQHTLCKAVFGEDDGEFSNALKGAQWEDEWGEAEHMNEDGRKIAINDNGEIFVEGIWEMVGWDILEGI